VTRILTLWLLLAIAATAQPDQTPFPKPPNIKGLQVQMVPDALELGIHHAGLNLVLSQLLDLEKKPGNPRWTVDGEEFSFAAGPLQAMDQQIKPLSDAGVVVYVILLISPTKNAAKDAILLHPDAKADRKFIIGGFNSVTEPGRKWLRAVSEFLSARYSGENAAQHGRVWGWIIGNELNSHFLWHNMGRKTLPEAVKHYESAFRIMHRGIKTASSEARCYLSLDHHWAGSMHNVSAEEAHSGRDFLDTFAATVKAGGDYDWHLAQHPYPEDLRNPRVWADKGVKDTNETNKVSFKNLQVLSQHMAEPAMLWQGKPRRVILSEQGFHTLPQPDGQQLQAAAYAYAWEKCARLPLVDAFIYHRHVDNSREGDCRFGLWNHKKGTIADPAQKKQLHALFQKAGTPEWSAAAAFALPIAGLKSWDELKR
jgi:hypothetical protein